MTLDFAFCLLDNGLSCSNLVTVRIIGKAVNNVPHVWKSEISRYDEMLFISIYICICIKHCVHTITHLGNIQENMSVPYKSIMPRGYREAYLRE